MGERHIPPHFEPSCAYSPTLPQGVECLLEALVQSIFCPINASPNESPRKGCSITATEAGNFHFWVVQGGICISKLCTNP